MAAGKIECVARDIADRRFSNDEKAAALVARYPDPRTSQTLAINVHTFQSYAAASLHVDNVDACGSCTTPVNRGRTERDGVARVLNEDTSANTVGNFGFLKGHTAVACSAVFDVNARTSRMIDRSFPDDLESCPVVAQENSFLLAVVDRQRIFEQDTATCGLSDPYSRVRFRVGVTGNRCCTELDLAIATFDVNATRLAVANIYFSDELKRRIALVDI